MEDRNSQISDISIPFDEKSFREFFFRHYRNLFYFIQIKTHDEDLTKDILQDTFLKVWENSDKIDPSKSLKSFLYTVASNTLIDHQRKKTNSNISLSELHPEEEIEDLSENQESEFSEKIRFIIERQPSDLQEIFHLSKVEGYKNSEIADMLGISIKTVEAKMTKLLKIFRKLLHLFLIGFFIR